MTLYHGTNTDIEKIDLQIGSQYKDFGRGFYLDQQYYIGSEKALQYIHKICVEKL